MIITGTISGATRSPRTSSRPGKRPGARPPPPRVPRTPAPTVAAVATFTVVANASSQSRSVRKTTYQWSDRSRGGSVSHRVLLNDMGTRARMGVTRKRAPAAASPYITAFMSGGSATRPEHPVEAEQAGRRHEDGDGGDEEPEGEHGGQGPGERLAHVGLDQHGHQGHLAAAAEGRRDEEPEADHDDEHGPRRHAGQTQRALQAPGGLPRAGAEAGGEAPGRRRDDVGDRIAHDQAHSRHREAQAKGPEEHRPVERLPQELAEDRESATRSRPPQGEHAGERIDEEDGQDEEERAQGQDAAPRRPPRPGAAPPPVGRGHPMNVSHRLVISSTFFAHHA